jgi:myosin-5
MSTRADVVRYYLLVSSSEWNAQNDVKVLCDTILKQTLKEEDKYQIGLTKIFFRAGMLAVLEGLRTARLNQLVTVVQKNVRRWIELRRFRDLKAKTIKIQGWWRIVLAKRLAEDMRREKAALKIQTVARGWMARKDYARTRAAVIRIQSGTSHLNLCLI